MGKFGYLHDLKEAMILKQAAEYGCKVFVETGTLYGEMVEMMLDQFDCIFSIELSQEFAERAKNMFADHSHVTILQGDSGKVLKEVLPQLNGPTLFWLDAHYSGGATVMGDKETPILEELEAILAVPSLGHVIIIDDLQQFMFNPAYPGIDVLRQFIEIRCPEAEFEVLGDPGMILVFLPRGDNNG